MSMIEETHDYESPDVEQHEEDGAGGPGGLPLAPPVEAPPTPTPAAQAAEGRPMTLAEAGRLGGLKRKQALGDRGYAQLGQRGGESVKRRYGPDFYSKIGKKGGEARKQALGHEGYVRLGRMRAEQSRQIEEREE